MSISLLKMGKILFEKPTPKINPANKIKNRVNIFLILVGRDMTFISFQIK
jgi:hypothetical protein